MMRKVKMTKDHNGYATGETVELEPAVADVFVEWVGCAVYADEAPATPQPLAERKSDKSMKTHGGKSLVKIK